MFDSVESSDEQSILELSSDDAKKFFLKQESYCNFPLPPYFVFDELLSEVEKFLSNLNQRQEVKKFLRKARNHENVNHLILDNKNGKYAWRPLQLIHPVLYVNLAIALTENHHWDFIKERFSEFSQFEKIKCLSIPSISPSEKISDKEQLILGWWH